MPSKAQFETALFSKVNQVFTNGTICTGNDKTINTALTNRSERMYYMRV